MHFREMIQHAGEAAVFLRRNKLIALSLIAMIFYYREPIVGIFTLLFASMSLLCEVIVESFHDISDLSKLLFSNTTVCCALIGTHLICVFLHML